MRLGLLVAKTFLSMILWPSNHLDETVTGWDICIPSFMPCLETWSCKPWCVNLHFWIVNWGECHVSRPCLWQTETRTFKDLPICLAEAPEASNPWPPSPEAIRCFPSTRRAIHKCRCCYNMDETTGIVSNNGSACCKDHIAWLIKGIR